MWSPWPAGSEWRNRRLFFLILYSILQGETTVRMSKKFAAIAIVATTALAGTAAFAYWTSSGSGSGSATTGDTSTVTVNQVGDPIGLFPGSPAQPLSGNFNNPGSPAVIASVTATVSATDKAGCNAADFDITGTSTVSNPVPNGNGVGAWNGLFVSMENTASNQDVCKNAVLTISYTANAL
jgi:hypothetical protein